MIYDYGRYRFIPEYQLDGSFSSLTQHMSLLNANKTVCVTILRLCRFQKDTSP